MAMCTINAPMASLFLSMPKWLIIYKMPYWLHCICFLPVREEKGIFFFIIKGGVGVVGGSPAIDDNNPHS